MTRIFAILIALALALQSLAAVSMETCCCDEGASVPAHESDGISDGCGGGCCGLHDNDPAPDPDEPTDDCDCPLPCCGVVKAPVANVPLVAAPVPHRESAFVGMLGEQRSGSPHLLGLTRPPRDTTPA